jgi:glycosyltransferase involved in cell wall biosynthesis
MFKGNKIVVVMPAYNAEKTLLKTHSEVLSQGIYHGNDKPRRHT